MCEYNPLPVCEWLRMIVKGLAFVFELFLKSLKNAQNRPKW